MITVLVHEEKKGRRDGRGNFYIRFESTSLAYQRRNQLHDSRGDLLYHNQNRWVKLDHTGLSGLDATNEKGEDHLVEFARAVPYHKQGPREYVLELRLDFVESDRS
jgi:hypothetical protein